jgi:hypothetical protein
MSRRETVTERQQRVSKSEQRKTKHTRHIKLRGYGSSETGARFVQLEFPTEHGCRRELLRIDNLSGFQKEQVGRLNRLGAHLINHAAQTELLNRIQARCPSKERFKVATRVGYTAGEFALPDEVISAGRPQLKVCLQIEPRYTNKYVTSGTLVGAQKLLKLARGNTRFICGLALAVLGPIGSLYGKQPVAIQLVGAPGSGKTALARPVSAVIWGWNSDPNVGDALGFGETWNRTLSKLGPTAAAHSHTFLFLDETRVVYKGQQSRAQALLDSVMVIQTSQSTDKNDGTEAESWYVPVLSTSNKSLDELAADDGVAVDDAYRDRLLDVPLPADAHGVFENLHGCEDLAAFVRRTTRLAKRNHGVLGREFVRRLLAWRERCGKQVKARLDKWQDIYLKHCQSITDPKRNLLRVHQKFASVYVAGRAAIYLKLFPFTAQELLDAVLSCERDHVALVASFASVAQSPVARIRDYIADNRQQFADVRNGLMAAGYDHARTLGYRSRGEYYLTAEQFERIVGSKAAAQKAKVELDRLQLIRKGAGGKDGHRFVVKRAIGTSLKGKKQRRYVIAIDTKILKWQED